MGSGGDVRSILESIYISPERGACKQKRKHVCEKTRLTNLKCYSQIHVGYTNYTFP